MDMMKALEPYEYPEILYCDQCKADVAVRLEPMVDFVRMLGGGELSFRWRAAVCPACGHVLCSRDRDIAYANATAAFGLSQEGEQENEMPGN